MEGNMYRFCFIMSIIFGLCVTGQTSLAETQYVTDSLKIGLRTGPTLENRITHFLTSGQSVESLESQDGWSRVRVLQKDKDDFEGWVLSRYLTKDVPLKNLAISLRDENSVLKEKALAFEKGWKEASQNEQRLKADLEKKTHHLQELQREYDILKTGSKDFLKLKQEQKTMQLLLKNLQEKSEMLTIENESLRFSQRTKWLATGAVVLLCGLMIGLAVGRQQRKRKSSYY
jgi:SH3 domain protein